MVEDRRQPKALLQQWCARQGCLPPRFEKLPVGGQRMAAAGIRYSVTLEAAPPSGPARKKKARDSLPCCIVMFLVIAREGLSTCALTLVQSACWLPYCCSVL